MKTKLTGIVVLVLLISLMVPACFCSVKADSANSIGFDSGVRVFSPLNITYYYSNLVLNLSLYGAGILGSLDPQVSMNYNIDGVYNGSVPLKTNGETHVVTLALATVNLPKLPDGSHFITIYLFGLNQKTHEPKYASYINTIYFSIIDDITSSQTSNPALAPTFTPSPYQNNSTISKISPSSNMLSSSNIPEFSLCAILSLLFIISSVMILKRLKKRSRRDAKELDSNRMSESSKTITRPKDGLHPAH